MCLFFTYLMTTLCSRPIVLVRKVQKSSITILARETFNTKSLSWATSAFWRSPICLYLCYQPSLLCLVSSKQHQWASSHVPAPMRPQCTGMGEDFHRPSQHLKRVHSPEQSRAASPDAKSAPQVQGFASSAISCSAFTSARDNIRKLSLPIASSPHITHHFPIQVWKNSNKIQSIRINW